MNYKRKNGTFHFEEDVFSRGAKCISEINHKVLLLRKFLQTKLEVKKKNFFNNFFILSIKIEMRKKL